MDNYICGVLSHSANRVQQIGACFSAVLHHGHFFCAFHEKMRFYSMVGWLSWLKAAVSKTVCWGFESLLARHFFDGISRFGFLLVVNYAGLRQTPESA